MDLGIPYQHSTTMHKVLLEETLVSTCALYVISLILANDNPTRLLLP